jgi:hypothetical protein
LWFVFRRDEILFERGKAMSRTLTQIVAVLLWCGVTTAPAANIIVVTEHEDRNGDGVLDDQGLVDWLVAEGGCPTCSVRGCQFSVRGDRSGVRRLPSVLDPRSSL